MKLFIHKFLYIKLYQNINTTKDLPEWEGVHAQAVGEGGGGGGFPAIFWLSVNYNQLCLLFNVVQQ